MALYCMLLVVVGLVISCQPNTAPTGTVKYSVALAGENHPTPVPNAGTGTFTGEYDKATRTLTYSLIWSLTSNEVATQAHFHGPADTRSDAGIAVTIFASTNRNGTFDSKATLTEAQASELLAGKWYINIHTAKNPAGALRGQIPAEK